MQEFTNFKNLNNLNQSLENIKKSSIFRHDQSLKYERIINERKIINLKREKSHHEQNLNEEISRLKLKIRVFI